MRRMRDLLSARLRENLRRELAAAGMLREGEELPIRINGHPEKRLPNTLSVSFRGVRANRLLTAVADTVAASAGA